MSDASQFHWDFALEGKSVVHEDENGDLFIEGYASDFDIDRDGEYMAPDALQKALASYMANPVLCYHHKLSEQMGRVVDARVDGKGLWIKARVAKPEAGTERMNRYMDVKRGDLRGFSIGGFFRKMVDKGRRMIHDIDLVEISLTPTPVNPRTLGAVAGKALQEDQDQALARARDAMARCEEIAASFQELLDRSK